MAKRRRASVREALEAATGRTMVPVSGRVPGGGDAVGNETGDGETALPETMKEQKERNEGKPPIGGDKKRPAGKKRSTPRKRTPKGHKKTSTGYLKTTGQEIVRLTLHLTPDQKKKLKIKSLQAGFDNTSAFIVDALKL